MADIERLIGFMALMQVPFMSDPDVLMYIEEVKTVLKQVKAQEPRVMEPQPARLLTAEEVQHIPDGETIIIEQLISREEEERGYIAAQAWAVSCNRNNAPDGGLLVSFFGTFFPNTIKKIPYKTIRTVDGVKGVANHIFRFWTARPTDEQSKAVKWD